MYVYGRGVWWDVVAVRVPTHCYRPWRAHPPTRRRHPHWMAERLRHGDAKLSCRLAGPSHSLALPPPLPPARVQPGDNPVCWKGQQRQPTAGAH